MARIASVNVSAVRTFQVGEKKLRSGILKEPVAGRVWLRSLGLDGDAQADHRFHGGPDKAVYVYGAEHYDFWRSRIRGMELPFGIFGENLTVTGFGDLEAELHAGDLLQVGTARIQLTDPRQPCWKLETRMGIPDFARAFLGSGRIGCYARVLSDGELGAGDEVTVVERTAGSVPLAVLIRALYFRDDAAKQEALAAAGLPERHRRRLERPTRNDESQEG